MGLWDSDHKDDPWRSQYRLGMGGIPRGGGTFDEGLGSKSHPLPESTPYTSSMGKPKAVANYLNSQMAKFEASRLDMTRHS